MLLITCVYGILKKILQNQIMHLNLETSEPNAIQAYSDNKIQINSIIYDRSLIVSREKIINDLPIYDIEDICCEQLSLLLQLDFKILIVGHNKPSTFPSKSLLNEFYTHNRGIEWMSIGAASRTYNVLLSEYREVAALFILSDQSPDMAS